MVVVGWLVRLSFGVGQAPHSDQNFARSEAGGRGVFIFTGPLLRGDRPTWLLSPILARLAALADAGPITAADLAGRDARQALQPGFGPLTFLLLCSTNSIRPVQAATLPARVSRACLTPPNIRARFLQRKQPRGEIQEELGSLRQMAADNLQGSLTTLTRKTLAVIFNVNHFRRGRYQSVALCFLSNIYR